MRNLFELPESLADMVGAAAISVTMIILLWLPALA